MVQLLEDFPGSLVMLCCAVVGWLVSRFTNKYFAALVTARDVHETKLKHLSESLDLGNIENEQPLSFNSSSLPAQAISKETNKTQNQRKAEARRRLRRQAKASQVQEHTESINTSTASSLVCLLEKNDECDRSVQLVSPAHMMQKTTRADVHDGIPCLRSNEKHVVCETTAAEDAVAAEVQEFAADEFTPQKEFMDGMRTNADSSIIAIETPTLLVESDVEISAVTECDQTEVLLEEDKKQDAFILSGSSTEDESNTTTFSEDDSSASKTSIPIGTTPPISERHVEKVLRPYAPTIDPLFHVNGDGWMTSFEDLQSAQLQNSFNCNSATFSEIAYSAHESTTSIKTVYSEKAFSVEERVFVPFKDVQGRILYTDGELVYKATMLPQMV